MKPKFILFVVLTIITSMIVSAETETYYPDPNVESQSVDGHVVASIWPSEDTWSNLVAHAGTSADDSTANSILVWMGTGDNSAWDSLRRSIFLFDTSNISDDATITGATFSVYGTNKADGGSWTPSINVYSSNPASNTSLVAGDFDSLGTTPFSDTNITYAGFSTTGYNDFAFNADGLAAISKTTNTKLGVRITDDAKDITPSWSWETVSYMYAYSADQAGTATDPKLVVTFTIAPPDTCTYGGSGNWDVDCSDNCSITAGTNVAGDIILNGVGHFEILADIKANSIAIESGCEVWNVPGDGNELAIAGG